ncbi:MAG: pectinesterase family protein, partial [Bacteroidales bacterium]|nr:pectinesterase family protein [Bacteroidales bacterium]
VFKYHGSHGGVFNNGNTFTLTLAEKSTVTFTVCEYSADGATLAFTDAAGNVLGSIEAESNGGTDGEMRAFTYAGSAQDVTATLVATGAVYIHAITIENAAPIVGLGGMVEVWDFGVEQLDTNMYFNRLDSDAVNAWYDTSIVVGTSANKIPNFTAGVLTWIGKPTSDRLRTTNEVLTRYDENVGGGSEHAFTGRVYANGTVSVDDSGLPASRYFTIEVAEDDEIVASCISQNGTGTLTFINESDPTDMQQMSTTSEVQDYLFVASANGIYRIFDASDKLSCYRIMHRNATFVNIKGDVDETLAANISAGYGILFKNVSTGKSWSTTVDQAAYDVALPAGFSYELSLSDANGYMISNMATIVVDADATVDLVVEQLELSTVSGSISGLGDYISNLELVYVPDVADKVYKPEVMIDATAGTYTAILETSCPYTISAVGVNDYSIFSTAINVTSDQVLDVVFTAKPVYDVALTAAGLDAEQLAALQVTFSNLNEEGYSYQFNDIESIVLRDGVYDVVASGIDSFPLMQSLTSNLVVEGANAEKSLSFDAVTTWNFDEKEIDGNAHFGLLFSPDGLISSQAAKGHLVGKPGGKIRIPVSNGDKVMISYYYNADFKIDADTQLITTSGSTSLIESYAYQFAGAEKDTLTLTIGDSVSTTYITRIKISSVLAYDATITVGADKDYKTINSALEAVRQMDRTNDERVSIVIDPGNYEEMIVIDQANVSLENAAAAPSIALANQGVDIDAAAVRITSYYGHGYSYYSMSNDQKWHEEVLAVNKENGYLSYVNKGSGTTNASYWNATLVVAAEGFVAKGIIIENSFNQYISQKESEDVVVEWETGGKGTRSTMLGDVAVQDRTFVERGAAIAITASGDKTQLVNCRIVGRQDSFYGSRGARLVMYGGAAMGAVDYIFGGMTAVFYKTDLVLNTSDASNDVAYITAAQQESGRGFLMYECHIKSPALNTETASMSRSKPGYFGRPWSPNTSEVVFFNTKIDKSAYPGSEDISLVLPAGWMSSLG